MKTYLDCIPCFFRQTLEASRIAGADEVIQKKIINRVAGVIPDFPMESSPPEMARIIHGIIREETGNDDPYLEIKKQSTTEALKIYHVLKEKVKNSDDPLLTALEMAIMGNIIDYGVFSIINIEDELNKILSNEDRTIRNASASAFDYNSFRTLLAAAGTVMYLGDNAGETVFDRILMEEIRTFNPATRISFVVKGSPIINDAVYSDAIEAGIDSVAEVVSSGSNAPGTVLKYCTREFIDAYYSADIVISKGQGNFEALSEPGRDIIFLFLAKCPVIARDFGCSVGDINLFYKKIYHPPV
ncbi:MAG TPA: ARMT1-like domain-containing protein [Spirochaetota bacterium]|nr:ARMT1-like domain-containing protein [Spirochaetota bacterium]